jgi:hypothetical protein
VTPLPRAPRSRRGGIAAESYLRHGPGRRRDRVRRFLTSVRDTRTRSRPASGCHWGAVLRGRRSMLGAQKSDRPASRGRCRQTRPAALDQRVEVADRGGWRAGSHGDSTELRDRLRRSCTRQLGVRLPAVIEEVGVGGSAVENASGEAAGLMRRLDAYGVARAAGRASRSEVEVRLTALRARIYTAYNLIDQSIGERYRAVLRLSGSLKGRPDAN